MRDAVRELGLEARIGIEAGEVVVDQRDSTFATGEAVNLAARLQQVAKPGEILLGPTAHRLARGRLLVEDAGPLELKGMGAALPFVARRRRARHGARRPSRAPLVGRETELELLENTYARTLRDGRAHLFTIYGEPGVGKSRLAREFVDSIEGASVLTGRCLPYGEGITYWPLAEMIKAATGISDDEPLEEAFEKLRACCEDDAVADLIGLAAGLLEAVEGERSAEEIAWAARAVMSTLGEVQPLVLFFEDIHWAEEPLLDLIEHLADWVRRRSSFSASRGPSCSTCGRGGAEAACARPRSSSSRCPRRRARSSSRRSWPSSTSPLAAAEGAARPHRGQPAVRRGDDPDDLGDSGDRRADPGHAAGVDRRADRPPVRRRQDAPPARGRHRPHLLGGRVAHLCPDVGVERAARRPPVARASCSASRDRRSTASSAFRFKHMLIREVAYAGLSKQSRAQQHRRFAEWLKERAGEEMLEIRAYHLDQAALAPHRARRRASGRARVRGGAAR